MTDQQYQNLDLVSLYDALNPLGRDSDYFIAACAPVQHSILDLGCGTGLLTASLAKLGHQVTGLDPAGDMLAIARRHDLDGLVTWIEGDAREIDLGKKFDRVIATGHVFQVFLTAADQIAFLQAAARHLAPEGRLIFDSRNPAAKAWRSWTPEQSRRRLQHAAFGAVEIWHAVTEVTEPILRFRSTYDFLDRQQQITSDSTLAFTDLPTLRDRMSLAGLEILTVHGDWTGGDFQPESPEIILTARKSSARL